MRLRRRHAWGAALIALFALPVLRPQGVAAVEDPPAGLFAWLASAPALNPRLWDAPDGSGDDSPRVQALERTLAEVLEARSQEAVRASDLDALKDALRLESLPLDRLPLARRAGVLRSRDAAPARRSILIDRGSDHGLKEGLPVVAGGVYVGRLQVVRAGSSLVQLVTDPRSRLEVAVRTEKDARVTGFLRRRGPGAGSDELEIACVRLVGDVGRVPEHRPVFTSNADALVPAGLLVGYVSQVSDPEADGFPTLVVRPALDLERSTEVLVLLPRDER